RVAVSQSAPWVALQAIHQGIEKTWIGVVVCFSDPHILSGRQGQPLVPLYEGVTGISFIADKAAVMLVGESLQNIDALVGRRVVEQNDLAIAKGLLSDTGEALA